MINKTKFFSQIFKIDKKKSEPFSIKKILKSIFFIKYIMIIFTFLFIIYLIVPKVFNYENKLVHLKKNLLKNYSIEIKQYSEINYNILPTPRLVFLNSKLMIDKELINGNVKLLEELCDKVKLLLKEHYIIDMKITNQKVYNVMNRPHMAHKLLNAIITVNKNISL